MSDEDYTRSGEDASSLKDCVADAQEGICMLICYLHIWDVLFC